MQIKEKYGAADILLVRHVVEHAYDISEFVAAIRLLVKSDGYIIWELPDCKKALLNGDCTMVWEEHIHYFTEFTFKQFLLTENFNIIDPKDLRLHFQIGAGGMGSVYKATYGERTEVAAKEVHCFDESEFEKEVRNLCSLHHPNILRVFGVCTKPAEMCNDGREHKYIVTGTFLWILS